MKNLLEPKGKIDPQSDPQGLFRTLKTSLAGEEIVVLRSPYDFTKKTRGAAEGVNYLLDERGMLDAIKQTGADVRQEIIELGAPLEDITKDPNIRHRDATIDIATKGANKIEEAIRAGRKVVMVRGAHDAMDLSGLLRATNGNVCIIIVDTHADIHSPSSSTSKNPHGMWVRALLGEGEGLDPVMKDTPKLKPENIIYIGPSQMEKAEVEYLRAKGVCVFTGYNLHNIDAINKEVDERQQKMPIWLNTDEDGMVDAAATMPGGMVSPELLKHIANRIGTNQQLEGMHQVLGVCTSEFQRPDDDDHIARANAERQADVIISVVHQALGAGYKEESTDTGNQQQNRRVKPRKPNKLQTIAFGTTAAAALILGTIAGFLSGKKTSDSTPAKPTSFMKVPPKSGLLLAATMNPDYRPGILDRSWEPKDMSKEGRNVIEVFSEYIARYGKDFQKICDESNAGRYSKYSKKDAPQYLYIPNQRLAEMMTYLYEAEQRDPSATQALRTAVLATFEATFERKEGRTTASEGFAMFETLYGDFKSRTDIETAQKY